MHSCCLPAIAYELRTIYPVASQAKDCTSQEIEKELEKAIGSSHIESPVSI